MDDKPIFSGLNSWLLMLAALAFDAVHLLSGGRSYSARIFHGLDPGFFPMVWAPFAFCLAAGSLLQGGAARRQAALAFLAAALHLALTVLGHDLFAARSQAAVLFLWIFIFGRGLFSKALVLVLAGAYFPGEGFLVRTEAFASLSHLDWLNPLSGPALALDMTLKEAAFQSSGLWGLGPEYLGRLDFVTPWMMRLNALPYLTAMSGRGGLMIYSALVLSILFALVAVKTRSDPEVASLMPAWLLVASNQYLTLILFLGWRSVGQTHPPAFLAGAGTGQEMLLLALLAVPRLRGRSKRELSDRRMSKPMRGDAPKSGSPSPGQGGGGGFPSWASR